MGEKSEKLLEYSGLISRKLINNNVSSKTKDFAPLDFIPLIKGKQAIYVVDWYQNKIKYSRGTGAFLGYGAQEFALFNVLENLHPEDEKIVSRVVKAVVNHCTQENVAGNDEYLNITYRIRHKDGRYIKVLRKSGAFEVNEKGSLISNWSILTDIEFISNQNQVEWDIYANGMDVQKIKNTVYAEFSNFFTKTELRIIEAIKNGHKSEKIAKDLNVSIHTVYTHRKNINRKSNCNNSKQLISFCRRNGII